jgi:hypothetical protein
MDMSPIIARLEALKPGSFRRVGGALDLAAVKAVAPNQSPALFIIPAAESASRPGLITDFRQTVKAAFEVVIAVRAVNDPTGATAADPVEACRAAVRASLLGWTPPAAFDPVEYVRGALVDLADATVWWSDQYSVTYHITA